MAAKRRRSRSGGGGAIGCAPFFVLIIVALIIQYWWVLLIAAGVVALTVALVRSANAPARPVRMPQPPPQPLRPPPPPRVPSGEELTAQMRAHKRISRVRDMQEWDYEWLRLAHPGKSVREVNEIANAHFARGRSIGLDGGDPSVP
ncbi:hypothetical protein [Pseudarthrobacter niigatensis]|uniref:Uncharacterized protein (DUF58 family) n=1 Tax=Pseudarthrobacter niigatensis TaxID=369935 RepID=A0AAJ1SRU6_9MICC|nr:hypothetical protein [Pseudarthrobacter niigatensis]MDQ0146030.1 uncharacterized protein (DUF58 family) [Pseudarthrobacter niigatensis]MDQ0266242.1 uncharacterized protein (DUF58 family) [Pseudarthrobacter niigatensis]